MTEQDNTTTENETSGTDEAPVSTYQRAGTAPARAPSGYPGSYGYSAGLSSDADSNTDRRLTIGAGITICQDTIGAGNARRLRQFHIRQDTNADQNNIGGNLSPIR